LAIFYVVLRGEFSSQYPFLIQNNLLISNNHHRYLCSKNADGTTTFSTGNGFGDGQIEITEYDAVNKTVTGTFRFNADNLDNNPLFGPALNFQQGVFYNVPIN
jgi:hypothetical protein